MYEDVVLTCKLRSSGILLAFIQPSKLNLLLGRHLATNSFDLGRLFYKSSRQLQNFRWHDNQNGHNLESCL